MSALRVLLVGESWITYATHLKGMAVTTGVRYERMDGPLSNALRPNGIELAYVPCHEAGKAFPFSLDELAAYNVIVFSDCGSDTFLLHPDTTMHSKVVPNRLQLVREYVRNGGGFVMIGGYLSFAGLEGRAHFAETPIEEILPVQIRGWDDRVEAPEGVMPTVLEKDHPILEDVPTDWPLFLGYNRIQEKPGSHVLLKCGNDPFLIVGEFGRGRAVAFASDCAPHWGTPEFLSWHAYPTFWSHMMRWAARVI